MNELGLDLFEIAHLADETCASRFQKQVHYKHVVMIWSIVVVFNFIYCPEYHFIYCPGEFRILK